MTYHIVLRYLFIDVLRIVPFVLHHEPSNERGLEPLPAYSALTRIFRQYVYPNIPSFSIVSLVDSFMTPFSLWTV